MLVFIDESGHPRPGDSATRPVILAACIREKDIGRLTRAMFAMKRSLLSKLILSRDEEEGKATAFLSRYALTKVVAKREYVDSLFEMLRDFDLRVFGVVMERPSRLPYQGPDFLQNQHYWLLQRIEWFMEKEDPDGHAIPIFDGQDPSSNRNFSACFTSFLARTNKGKALRHIVPTPLFVDSSLTPGIQISDLFAYVTRINHEQNLYQTPTVSDPYLSAIKRYASIVKQRTINFERDDGFISYGIATMDANKFFYAREDVVSELLQEMPTDTAIEPASAADPLENT